MHNTHQESLKNLPSIHTEVGHSKTYVRLQMIDNNVQLQTNKFHLSNGMFLFSTTDLESFAKCKARGASLILTNDPLIIIY